MRIRFITLYYPPEIGAAQRRISELAGRLAKRGHQITILTGFPNYPSGQKPPGYRGKLIMREFVDGCTIIRVPHYIAPNKGFMKRLLIHLTFACSASLYSIGMARDDIIYLESPPLFNGFIGVLTRWVRRIPFLFNLADLWPQTAVELGVLKNQVIIKLASKLESFFYSRAAKILAITAGLQRELISRGYSESKVPLLTNGVDHEVFRDDVPPNAELRAFRPQGGLLVIYAGTHGLVYSLETTLVAADKLKQAPIHFLFIGDGAEKERLMAMADGMALTNVTFLPPRSPQEMPGVFRAADLAIISLRDFPVANAIMPVKCIEIMASGVPILFAAKGEMAGHIMNAGCGQVIAPENPELLADAVLNFAQMAPEARTAIGQQGRSYVIQHFSRDAGVTRLEELMHEVIADDK